MTKPSEKDVRAFAESRGLIAAAMWDSIQMQGNTIEAVGQTAGLALQLIVEQYRAMGFHERDTLRGLLEAVPAVVRDRYKA